jgi:dephospho-CoA kinase
VTRLVALTGGIGTGKSTVARMFEELGATVLDADAIVRELQAPGAPVLDEIVAVFGPEVLDASGALDREALGAVVFRDAQARRRLEAIVHPRVGAEMARRVAAARAAGVPLVVLDIPLLFEVRRIGAQLPIEEKRALADHVIDNTGPVEETERQVRQLVRLLGDGP